MIYNYWMSWIWGKTKLLFTVTTSNIYTRNAYKHKIAVSIVQMTQAFFPQSALKGMYFTYKNSQVMQAGWIQCWKQNEILRAPFNRAAKPTCHWQKSSPNSAANWQLQWYHNRPWKREPWGHHAEEGSVREPMASHCPSMPFIQLKHLNCIHQWFALTVTKHIMHMFYISLTALPKQSSWVNLIVTESLNGLGWKGP